MSIRQKTRMHPGVVNPHSQTLASSPPKSSLSDEQQPAPDLDRQAATFSYDARVDAVQLMLRLACLPSDYFPHVLTVDSDPSDVDQVSPSCAWCEGTYRGSMGMSEHFPLSLASFQSFT